MVRSSHAVPAEQQIQATCPDFREFTEHENIDTDEAPCYIHGTRSMVVGNAV